MIHKILLTFRTIKAPSSFDSVTSHTLATNNELEASIVASSGPSSGTSEVGISSSGMCGDQKS